MDVVNCRNSILYRTTAIRGAVEQCPSVYTVQRRVCGANSLLLNFTDIRVRSDTLRIFTSGTDAIVQKCTWTYILGRGA